MYIKIYIDIYTSRERERKHDARLLSWSDYCFPQVSFFFVLIIIYRLSNKFSITHSRDEVQ